MSWWEQNKARFDELKRAYGKVAIGTYLVLWIGVLVGYAVAFKLGYTVEGFDGTGSLLFGSWVAAKVTQPARIAATVVLTPFVAKVLRRPPNPEPVSEDA